MPAREVPLDDTDIRAFRRRYRERFEGQPSRSRIYREVSEGIAHGGIEYYLPLFFEETATFLDYLPKTTVVVKPSDLDAILQQTWQEILDRYDICRLDPERPILGPEECFIGLEQMATQLTGLQTVSYSAQSVVEVDGSLNLPARLPPALRIESRFDDAAAALLQFIAGFDGRVLFTAESAGRREAIIDLLQGRDISLRRVDDWRSFLESDERIGVTIAPVDNGVLLEQSGIAVISEQQLFGERPRHTSRRRRSESDPETIIRQLNDLATGRRSSMSSTASADTGDWYDPRAGGIDGEFLQLEYADGDKLYVPVHALELISRYSGASPENAPLHRLGSDQWAKARQSRDQQGPRRRCRATRCVCKPCGAGRISVPLAGGRVPRIRRRLSRSS